MREAVCRYWRQAPFPPGRTELATPGGPRAIAERYNEWAQTHGREPLRDLAGQTDGEITGLLFETMLNLN